MLGPYRIGKKIIVKAVDVHGAESDWSDPINVFVIKNPLMYKIFNRK